MINYNGYLIPSTYDEILDEHTKHAGIYKQLTPNICYSRLNLTTSITIDSLESANTEEERNDVINKYIDEVKQHIDNK